MRTKFEPTRPMPENWQQVKDIFSRLPSGWYFRGQGNADWGLASSLERHLSRPPSVDIGIDVVERSLLEQFRSVATRLVDPHLVPDGDVDWLALMQHHGAPTRLMDWTDSPYVAAFFALENTETDSAVWAINKFQLWKACSGHLEGLTTKPNPIHLGFHHPTYHDAIFSGEMRGVFPVVPSILNERIYLQQGLFLMAGDVNLSFESNMLSMPTFEINRLVYKIVIPAGCRTEALLDLGRMNINRSTLFPGIDGYAQSFRTLLDLMLTKAPADVFASALLGIAPDYFPHTLSDSDADDNPSARS